MSVSFSTKNDIGIIEFDSADSKVNILTADVLVRFGTILDEVRLRTSLQALLLTSAKSDIFIAGADIKEIEVITDPQEGQAKAKFGQDVFNKLEDLKLPTIAVIDGAALGGGCELALACEYRVATFNEKVKIGLPEVNLGILPGFGGTYRLQRIVGIVEGLKMILSGKPVDANKALKIGLVDRLFPQQGLSAQLEKFVEEICNGQMAKSKFLQKRDPFFLRTPLGRAIVFRKSHESVIQQTKGLYPAPLKVLQVVKHTIGISHRQHALEIESKAFSELVVTRTCKNLIHVFYLSEKYRKLKFEGATAINPQPIEKVGVLGAGIMGGGIAQLLSAKGIWVRLKDINYDAVAKGFQAANKIFQKAVERRKMTKAEAGRKMAQMTGTLDYSGFGNADLVIEAVVEDLKIKKKVFQELSERTPRKTILATNTSALSVTEIAQATRDPSKVIGLHFFNPVDQMPLVEVITTPHTSKETIVSTLELAKRLGKIPILVKDSCGFVVNRILLAYLNEAGYILEECGDVERIDKIMTDFGMPMGPFSLCDEVGLDVGYKVLKILEHGFGKRFEVAPIFERIHQEKWLGKKSGKGFYLHGKKRTVNPGLDLLLAQKQEKPEKKESSFDELQYLQRMVYTMINEAARCLEEKIVDEPGAIDVGMIFGTGFPAFRGGLLRYADETGLESIVERLEYLKGQVSPARFACSPTLFQMKVEGKSFLGV